MKKIIAREITNEDGDVYGVVGNITRLGAYRAIRADLRGFDLEDDVIFSPNDLEVCDFWHTEDKGGEYEDWTWWAKPAAKLKPTFLGKGWILKI